jgi:uncharacterized membrane protein YcjF (UPF0283 family)
LDWITLSVEAVGLVILLCWIVVPIREFRGIFKRLKIEEAQRDPHDVGRDGH